MFKDLKMFHTDTTPLQTLQSCISLGLFIWLLYILILFAYRLTFHPLAKFPGPKIAGMSYMYEFWYDVVCWGRYTRKILHMHEHYGNQSLTPNAQLC